MTTNYDKIAKEYKSAKQQLWRQHIERFTLFKLLGDLKGKTVLDLACGEGFYSRLIKRCGAARVVGVDISQGMIDLAQHEEDSNPLGIDYLVQDIKQLELHETFDVVVAAYLLNYAQTYNQLLKICSVIARHLKDGCRLLLVNNNPQHLVDGFMSTRKYGFIKRAHGPLIDGTPVDYIFFLGDDSFVITNYHLSIETHESAFQAAGFRRVTWHNPKLSPEIFNDADHHYWSGFLEQPPIIFVECEK